MEELVDIKVRVPESVRREFNSSLSQKGLKAQRVLARYIENYIEQHQADLNAAVAELMDSGLEISADHYPEADREWHDMLHRILTEGSARQKLGIQSNLEAFIAQLSGGAGQPAGNRRPAVGE